MVDWKLRKLNEKDIEDLFNWRNFVARREKTMQYFIWEYLHGPWGPVETWVADYNGEIIGQYSTQRYETFFFGKKMIASLSFDTGTHPDFRRQGIFATLGNYFFKEEGKQNIHFSTGFPNENFWPGGKKFGWKDLCQVPLYVNSNITELDIKKSDRFEFEEIKKFDDEFKGFSEGFKDEIPIYLNRTKKYLNWRFDEKPSLKDSKYHYNYSKYRIYDKSGELISYIVTKIFQDKHITTLHLVDFLTHENERLYNDILAFLIQIAKSLKIGAISLYVNKFHLFCKFLETKGFRFTNTNRVYIVRTNNDYLDKETLYDERNHYITMADSDVI